MRSRSPATTAAPRLDRALRLAASPKWLLAWVPLTAACGLAAAYQLLSPTAAMLGPLTLLATNLAAAIAARPSLRTDAALLLIHLALLALLLLFALGRLSYFEGTLMLNAGAAYDGRWFQETSGPWHVDRRQALRFINEGFTENFSARGRHSVTYNRVHWWDTDGSSRVAVIGDDHPLLIDGYRIYATKVRGFSPSFLWRGDDGGEELGQVQLSDDRSGSFAPARSWVIPGGPEAWAMMQLAGDNPANRNAFGDSKPGPPRHEMVVRIGEHRYELKLGQTVDVPGGNLTYLRLDSWMGYRVVHDPTRPWLLAAVLVFVGSLVWYYARRFGARAGSVNE